MCTYDCTRPRLSHSLGQFYVLSHVLCGGFCVIKTRATCAATHSVAPNPTRRHSVARVIGFTYTMPITFVIRAGFLCVCMVVVGWIPVKWVNTSERRSGNSHFEQFGISIANPGGWAGWLDVRTGSVYARKLVRVARLMKREPHLVEWSGCLAIDRNGRPKITISLKAAR